MSRRQDISGNALEYAIARQAACAAGVRIKKDAVSDKARKDFFAESAAVRQQLAYSAEAAVGHVFALEESRLELPEKCFVVMQTDARGQAGDPRDILSPLQEGVLGLSVKRNNDTFKNPRLQRNNPDFFQKWGLQGKVSVNYRQKTEKVFKLLDRARSRGVKKWSDLPSCGIDLRKEIYKPLVADFIAEFRKGMSPGNCARFTRYMLGDVDYYKIIVHVGQQTIVQGINFDNSLSCSSVSCPEELILAQVLSSNTGILTFEGGWVYTMRIHNASSRLEDSLKWDVKLIAHPADMYSHHII